MRGADKRQEAMFSYLSPEQRVPADHPLRAIRRMVDALLQDLSPELAKLYAEVGRPSIAPERLLRALLLQIFYSVRALQVIPYVDQQSEADGKRKKSAHGRGELSVGAGHLQGNNQ
jgi:transposase